VLILPMTLLGVAASCVAGTPAGECNDTGGAMGSSFGDALVGVAVLALVVTVALWAFSRRRR
jgi:hypothetical protein